ncbi:MAG: tetratricopeptide repeat protein [Myxococcales bacterium]|nr:tetratricopeptide repeat protein [Myxococcales bacterium]
MSPLSLLLGAWLLAAPPPKVAWLPLARQHLVEGRLDRAVKALQGARACWAKQGEACGFAKLDYDALLGAVYFQAGDLPKAAEALSRVLAQDPARPALWLFLAQAHLKAERYAEAAEAFAKGEPAAEGDPVLYGLWARAHLKADAPQRALDVLRRGLDRAPGADLLRREAALLFARLGLARAATAEADALQDSAERRTVLMAVASALHAASDPLAAAEVLTQLLLRAPDDLDAAEQRARLWAVAGEPGVAARLFRALAPRRPALWAAAADQARLAGDLSQALRDNGKVPDAARRLTQRLALLLAAERWAAAHTLGARLPTLDDEQRYRLAYAALRAGHPADARRLARTVQAPAHRAGAARLAQAAQACLDTPARCP